jgi:hypothetical protein
VVHHQRGMTVASVGQATTGPGGHVVPPVAAIGVANEPRNRHGVLTICHQVLSRSHLNAVIKLKDAGILTRNLVVLPTASNISLANNGTHLSLGSRRLARLLADPASGVGPAFEKHLADLVIKIVEHFLPLFVGTYSAAPYRLDFQDFRPEQALGFLPHELDFTHLRMIWRRWKRKADVKVAGIRSPRSARRGSTERSARSSGSGGTSSRTSV